MRFSFYVVTYLSFILVFSQTVLSKETTLDNSYWQSTSYNKYKYLTVSTLIAVGPFSFATMALYYSIPDEHSGWKDKSISIDNWKSNVEIGLKSPVYDRDNFLVNYVSHPYVGGLYYMQARNAGYGPIGSFNYSALMSFVWEFGWEAFMEPPSKIDLFVTPIIGSFVGEAFYYLSQKIKDNNNEVLGSSLLGESLLTFMDPMYFFIEKTALKNWLIKNKNKQQSYTYWGFTDDSFSLKAMLYIN